MQLLTIEKLTDAIRDEAIKLAEEIERKYSLRCAVLANPYVIKILDLTLSFWLCPPTNSPEDPDFLNRANQCTQDYNHPANLTQHDWSPRFILHPNGFKPWLERYAKENSTDFLVKDMAQGADAISEVVYGQPIVDLFLQQAEEHFGKEVIAQWPEAFVQRMAEKQLRLEEMKREEAEKHAERRKLLNLYEQAELQAYLCEKIIPYYKEKGLVWVVGIDGSGRPVAKAIEALGLTGLQFTYVSPKYLRTLDLTNPEVLESAAKLFETEFPELTLALRNLSGAVLFVDDQIGEGSTSKQLETLVATVSGRSDQYALAAVSYYQGNNTPSWLRNRPLQGILPPEDGTMSFKSTECPTDESEAFYASLIGLVRSWNLSLDST